MTLSLSVSNPISTQFYYRDPNWCGLHWPNMHKESYQKDWQRSEVGKVCPLIAQVVKAGGSWPKWWDRAHHLGTKHLKGLQNLTRLMAHHSQGSKPCPLCDAPTHPLIEHVLTQHHSDLGLSCISDSPLSTDKLLTLLVDCDICFVYKLWTIFNNSTFLTPTLYCLYLLLPCSMLVPLVGLLVWNFELWMFHSQCACSSNGSRELHHSVFPAFYETKRAYWVLNNVCCFLL